MPSPLKAARRDAMLNTLASDYEGRELGVDAVDTHRSLQLGGRPADNMVNDKWSIVEVLYHMWGPILRLQEERLESVGKAELIEHLEAYAWFRIGLGMVRPNRIDDIWDTAALGYNRYMSRLFDRKTYYKLHKWTNVDVTELLLGVNDAWKAGWILGGAASADETIVPHKGRKAGPFRQFVPRKPHNTGIKLYVVSDGVKPYVWDVFLHTGVRGVLHGPRCEGVWGHKNPLQVVQRWSDLLPARTTIICDSFFGHPLIAKWLQRERRPFLILHRQDGVGVFHGAQGLEPGGTHVTVNKATKIALHLYKHPAIGGKKTKVVPFLTNVAWDIPAEEHRSKAYIVPPIVGAYRALSSGVDPCNQMALQLRELGRFRTWSKAVRAFILRYAMSNTFATCQVLHLLPPNTTMFEFQWTVMKERCHLESPSDLCTPSPSVAHLIVCTDTALMCQGCSKGRPKTRCSACGVHLHVKCFAPYHMR